MKISIAILFLLIVSCSTKKEAGYSDLLPFKEIKLKSVENLPLEYQFFQKNSEECIVNYSFDPGDFLSMRDSLGKWFVTISLELIIKGDQIGKPIILELKKDTVTYENKVIIDSFTFLIPKRTDVLIEIKAIDKNKHVFQYYSNYWERDFDFIPEDLSLWDTRCKCILNRSFIPAKSADLRLNESIHNEFSLEVYQNIFQPAMSMFSIGKKGQIVHPSPDFKFIGLVEEIENKLNELNVDSYCKLKPTNFSDKEINGSFEFTIETGIQSYLISPLIYLVSPNGDNTEDLTINTWSRFWAKASNNDPVKAEKLIQEFNNRVKYANVHYSSYKAGWQSDRGMMHILLGKPDLIQNDVRGEVWIYGFADLNADQFTFERNPIGLHKNDFVLERSVMYREIWQSAVLKWENGWVKDGNGY